MVWCDVPSPSTGPLARIFDDKDVRLNSIHDLFSNHYKFRYMSSLYWFQWSKLITAIISKKSLNLYSLDNHSKCCCAPWCSCLPTVCSSSDDSQTRQSHSIIQNDCSVFNCNIMLATGENTPSFGALTEFHPRNSLNVGVILKAENGVILPFSVIKTWHATPLYGRSHLGPGFDAPETRTGGAALPTV